TSATPSSQIPSSNVLRLPKRSARIPPKKEKIAMHRAITEMINPNLPIPICNEETIGARIGTGASQAITCTISITTIKASIIHRYDGPQLFCAFSIGLTRFPYLSELCLSAHKPFQQLHSSTSLKNHQEPLP